MNFKILRRNLLKVKKKTIIELISLDEKIEKLNKVEVKKAYKI